MRIAFMGTPDFAVPALRALAGAGHEVACVYTQPPRPGGRRGRELTKTPVHLAAEELGIEVRHPASLKDPAAQSEFAALDLDTAVVAAYGLILPKGVLGAPRHGCLNVHASLLPRWRGAAPVQRAILAGDEETGITIMQMEPGLDTGPMLTAASTPVDRKTAGELTAELAEMGARLMIEVLADLPAYAAVQQEDALATYAAKIGKEEARIDWSRGALQVERQIRALNPAPGAWFEIDTKRVKIFVATILTESSAVLDTSFATEPGRVLDEQLAIGCGDGAIRPIVVQPAGKPKMDYMDFLRGNPVPTGINLQ
ncbi:MAG TPA: methionyl-tRNA formyltransferase [Alteraurantiacibacter sp.]